MRSRTRTCPARRHPVGCPQRGFTALDAAEQAYARLVSDPGAPRVRTALGLLAAAAVRPLLTDQATPSAVIDQVWRALAARARAEGGQWLLLAVGCAVPKLRVLARHAARTPEVDRDEVAACVLAAFTDTLLTMQPLPAVDVLGELVRPAHNAAQRLAHHVHRARHAHTALSASIAPPPPPGHPDFVLADLVREQVITAEEADLIGRHRLEGQSLRQIAQARGWYPMKAHRILRDAEKRVVSALLPQE